MPEGQGRIVYADETTYDGEWKDGNSNGYGVMVLADGSRYQGYWRRGRY